MQRQMCWQESRRAIVISVIGSHHTFHPSTLFQVYPTSNQICTTIEDEMTFTKYLGMFHYNLVTNLPNNNGTLSNIVSQTKTSQRPFLLQASTCGSSTASMPQISPLPLSFRSPMVRRSTVRTDLANRPTEPMLVSFETRYTKLWGNRGFLQSGSRQTTPVRVGVTCGSGISVVRVDRIKRPR